MPVKWTPDKDQMLLLKILETHDLHVDAKKISGAWPDADGEKPTPRAITERLVKIRQNAKAAGSAHFGISSSQSKGSKGPKPRDSTPKKPKENGGGSPTQLPTPVSVKRKHEPENSNGIRKFIKPEPINEDDASNMSQFKSPSIEMSFSSGFDNPAGPSPPASNSDGMESPSKFNMTEAPDFSNLDDELAI